MSRPYIYKDNSRPRSTLEALQAAVINRTLKPYGDNEPIVYEFTHDRALLHQYYRLREVMYRRMFETDKFTGEEDLHDKLSHILIARRGRLCLGGCRLTIREPDEKWQLPMEGDHFKVRELFPHLPLDRKLHGEISRFAIMEDCGAEAEIFQGLCKVMYDKVVDAKIHYLFAKSTLTLARNWRLVANKFGVKTTRICDEIDVPENPIHPGLKWYLTLSDLSSLYRDIEAPAAAEAEVEAETVASPHLALID